MQQLLISRRHSTLVLMAESNDSIASMTANAAYWGVPSNRLIFFKRLPNREYRNVLFAGDVFLDTRNYGAHTVASDAMFGGSPVLTMEGASFSSRVAHSLNVAANVDIELVATSRKTYIGIMDSICRRQTGTLAGLHHKIESSFGRSLFNSSTFAKSLEIAYTSMHILNQSSTFPVNKPKHIWIL